MEVRLIVASGKDAPDEVTVAGPQCFIGRAEDCQLRPRSERVSRHHCVIIVEEAFVGVRDLGSTHGTLVNGEIVKGERDLKNGDRLNVGNVEFEVRLGVGLGGNEKPNAGKIEEAASRTSPASIDDDLDLDKWLEETEPQASDPARLASAATEPTTDDDTLSPGPRKGQPKGKPTEVVGVWKKGHWKPTSANPRDAAADALKDFFKKGGR